MHLIRLSLQIESGADYTTTIPSGIPNGDYIVRHEMIALHFATAPDAAQLFPSCAQIRITGGSSGSINAATARFPGAYKASDAGIHVPNVRRWLPEPLIRFVFVWLTLSVYLALFF